MSISDKIKQRITERNDEVDASNLARDEKIHRVQLSDNPFDISSIPKKLDKTRWYSNDNISEFIEDGEIDELIEEVTEKFEDVLDSLIIDRKNDPNAMGTGNRLAKMYITELMSGRYYPKPSATAFPNEGDDAYKGMLTIKADIKSMCSHHHQIVDGMAIISIIPNGKVLGLSKYIRLATWAARRGTLQEELCTDIKNLIAKETGSNDVAVLIIAEHGCCANRGVNQAGMTQTAVLGGCFQEHKVKAEFYDNVKIQLEMRNR